MAADTDTLKRAACEAIDRHANRIVSIGKAVWERPELGYQEVETARMVADCLESQGVTCRTGLALTGVKGVRECNRAGPAVAVLAELDAVYQPKHPYACAGTGAVHFCGHDIQVASMLGCAIGLQACDAYRHLSGRVVYFAVPNEESCCERELADLCRKGTITYWPGKAELFGRGEFDDVDMCIQTHVETGDFIGGTPVSMNGYIFKRVAFFCGGEESRAACEAAELAGDMLSRNAKRLQWHDAPLLGTLRFGENPSDDAIWRRCQIKGPEREELHQISAWFDRSCRAAALACGCRVRVETFPGYFPHVSDPGMTACFQRNLEQVFGPGSYRRLPHREGSTDFGVLCSIMPAVLSYMTGASAKAHDLRYFPRDPYRLYVGQAKTHALQLIDLLADGASEAQRILDRHKPLMSRAEMLQLLDRMRQPLDVPAEQP